MIGLIKKYGKLTVTTEYAMVPMDTLEKVNYCMEHKEPFGLEHAEGGVWVLDPKLLMAQHYWTTNMDHYAQYDTWQHFELLVMRLLYTHDQFVGKIIVYKFLLACQTLNKIQKDEHIESVSRKTLPDAERKDGSPSLG